MLEKIKDWWNQHALDMKVIFIVFVIVLLAVIYFCGIKGNNQENFWKQAPSYTVEENITQIS